MTNEQIIAAMNAKISNESLATLKDMAFKLADKLDDASMAVSGVILDVLMDKMSECDFVAFCEDLENAI